MSRTAARDGGTLAAFWAKADPKATAASHHTILGHSLDVAACAYALVAPNSVLRRRFAIQVGIAEDRVAASVAAACALHDIGKIDTRFQRKAPQVADLLRPHTASVITGSYDHGSEGFRQIEDASEDADAIRSAFGPGGLHVLRAVAGHHGALPTRAEPDPSRSALPRAARREDEDARRVFIDVVTSFFRDRGAELPWQGEVDGPLVQRLAGLCAIADWIGSNVQHFPYQPGPIADLARYWAVACDRATIACAEAGLARAQPVQRTFQSLFPGYEPRDVQLLTESVPGDEPALVIVEAEMGKGKTEAALALAARFMASGHADGLTLALPTMATSNAMFGRVEDIAGRLFASGEINLALAHSRSGREPRFASLTQRSLRACDPDAVEASVSCARWLLNRKRILLAQLGVGTIDQALQAALVVRHQFVRLFGLSRNVVIIDEVHAYDAYMEVLLEHLLSWLGALGVPVILLSATLPQDRRLALACAWSGAEPSVAVTSPMLAQQAPYPLVSVTSRRGPTRTLCGSPSGSRTVLLERSLWGKDHTAPLSAAVTRLLEVSARGGRVVWIRNTVKETQAAFAALQARGGDVEQVLFHARFRACDRRTIERAVLDRFGKTGPVGGRILIATQVVEQSLDLDFDEMHSDLAPVDLLLQRAGRLHRHVRARAPGFEQALLVVHGPDEACSRALSFGPSQHVYDVGTLWLADQALRARDKLNLPADIRTLVEESYHPASRALLLAGGGEALVEKEQRRAGELEAKRVKARRACIDPADGDPDGAAALDDDDDAVQAFTRDGTSTTILPCAWDGVGARALFALLGEANWHLDATRADAWTLAGDLLDQTLSLPGRRELVGIPPGDEGAWREWLRRFARFAEESGLGGRVVPLPMSSDAGSYVGRVTLRGRMQSARYSSTLGFSFMADANEKGGR